MNRDSRWKRITLEQQMKASPRTGRMSTPTCQPCSPEAGHRVPEPAQRFEVARDPKVPEVTKQFLPQCLMLFRYRQMAVNPAPIGNLPDCSLESVGSRATLDHPEPFTRTAPEMGEPQQVERPREETLPEPPPADAAGDRKGTNRVLSG